MTRWLMAPVIGVIALLGLVLAPGAALAHATLVGVTPGDGQALDRAPHDVVFRLDEPVNLVPGSGVVLAASGERGDTGRAHLGADGRSVVVPLRAGLPRGGYLATVRVVSADTHVVAFSTRFGIGSTAAAAPAARATPSVALSAAAAAARGLDYLGVVLALGAAGTAAALWPGTLRSRHVRRLVRAGALALLAGTLAELVVAGPQATGSGLAGALRLDGVGRAATSAAGVALLVRLAVLAALLPVLWRATSVTGRRVLALRPVLTVASAAVAVTIALRGHAAVGGDAWLAVPAATLHVLGTAAWLGGLTVLLAEVLRGTGPARLRSWSRVAGTAVGVVVATGGYQALRQVRPVAGLWTTRYGDLLVVKCAFVALALGAALVAHRRVVARDRAGAAGTVARSRRLVAVEAAASLAVLGLTAVLVAQVPARDAYGPPARVVAPFGVERLAVDVDTTRRGPQRIVVQGLDGRGRAAPLTGLSVVLSSADADVARLPVDVRRAGPGRWASVGAVVPRAGHWKLTIVAPQGATELVTAVDYRVW